MKTIILFSILFIISTNVHFSQNRNDLSKERYNFLVDSLSLEKDRLLKEKKTLLSEIDSLKNYITELHYKKDSSRSSELIRKYGKEVGNRIANRQVWKGMTDKMLEDSWGKPDKIDKNVENWGVFTQWYYGDITYFFRDGKMTDWEEKK